MGTTIKKRLAQSNIAMLVIPLLVAAALVLLGMGAAGLLLAADNGVALPQRGECGDEQVPSDDPGPGLQPAGGSGVPHRAGRAPADEKGGMMTMGFMTPFHGFCMALADSVPGVSGGSLYWAFMTISSVLSTICSAGTVLPEKQPCTIS